MKFGLIVNSDEPLAQDRRLLLDQHLERALAARQAGFGIMAVAHRYSFGPARSEHDEDLLYTWRLQPLLLLAHLTAVMTDTVDYCSAVLLSTSAHPVELAEQVSTLDTLCRGRFRLGLGLGWMPYEFQAFGVDYETRATRFTELLELYRALLTEPVVDYVGRFFRVENARLVAHPIQRPMPPLWVGASADVAVRRAARLGDAWVMSAHIDVKTLDHQLALFSAERTRLGLPIPTDRPVVRMVAIAEDRATAVKQMKPVLQEWYRRRGKWGWFITDGEDIDPAVLGGGRWIVGDPDDCAAQLAELRDLLGATDVIFNMVAPGIGQKGRLAMIDLLGREVLPRFT